MKLVSAITIPGATAIAIVTTPGATAIAIVITRRSRR